MGTGYEIRKTQRTVRGIEKERGRAKGHMWLERRPCGENTRDGSWGGKKEREEQH